MLRMYSFILGCLLCVSVTAQSSSDNNADNYEAKLKQLQQSIQVLQRNLNDVKNSRNQLQGDLQTSEEDIGELLKKIESLQGELASQKKQLTQLNLRQDELQSARQAQQKHIAADINATYRLGQQSQVKLLLNQQQPETVARISQYYKYFLSARADRIETYLDTIAELDALKPKIEQRTASLQNNQQKLQQRHKQLLTRQQERAQTLQRLNSSIAKKDDQLKKMAQDKKRLEQLLAEVTAAIANLTLPGDGAAFSSRKGQLAYPAQGRLLQRFGNKKIDGHLTWEGVLIAANEGSPVNAIHHGRVVFSDYLRGHGLLVIIDHGDGYMSLYAHNQSLLKETGDWVNSGDKIAKVGKTGGQNQAALYFEIRQNGSPTNPAKWCRAG